MMAKIEKKHISVLHVKYEADAELEKFINKNIDFLKNYLLLFDFISNGMKAKLEELKLKYILNNNLTTFKNENEELAFESNFKSVESRIIESRNKEKKEENEIKIINRLIRTGEEINNKGDIIILNKVNSASKISSDGNICIYGRCNGDIVCNGEYMILPKQASGKIIFRGDLITSSMLKYELNLVIKEKETLNIKNILSI